MDIGCLAKGAIVGLFSLSLQGCLQDEIERWADSDTYNFNGIYQSDDEDASFLSFENGVMRYVTPLNQVTKNYKVVKGQVHIILRNSSMEKKR